MKNPLLVCALLGALTFGAAGAASAQDTLPMPPEGWWEQVKGGESATYEMSQMGMQIKMRLVVDERQGSEITFSTHMEMPGMPPGSMPPQSQTIDFSDQEALKEQMAPEGATVKKVGTEKVTAAGREWDCTVYEIVADQEGMKMKMKLWHSADILPVFNNGSIKMEVEMEQGGMPMNISLVLTEYNPEGGAGEKQTGEAPQTGDKPRTGDQGQPR